jgi:succinate-acetate transporter protein
MIIATLMSNPYVSALLIGVAVVFVLMCIAYILEKCKTTKGENKLFKDIEYYLGF